MPDVAEPARYVVDASVVVALVASSALPSIDLIATFTGGTTLYAPDILPAEVDSALRGLELGGLLTPAQAAAARAQARALPIERWPWEVVADRAWDLRANLTTYDAGYVALAEELGAKLLTGDARIARSGAARCPIEVIALGG